MLNPPGEVRVERFGWTFCPGDKVMQVVNDHERQVYNGDLGVVARMDMEEGELVVDFEGRGVAYGTVHKSQGSEHPAVVIPLTTQHFPMLQRNLVYTGVTRGKRLVVLVGQRKALAIAVRGQQTRHRCSKLKEWLASASPWDRRRQGKRSEASRSAPVLRLAHLRTLCVLHLTLPCYCDARAAGQK